MSSFKRRATAKIEKVPTGSKTSSFLSSTFLTSSGIPSLDDILGGGIPLSTTLLVLAPDLHSAYGNLVLKYFVSQGISSGQRVCIVSPDSLAFVRNCMWLPKSSTDGDLPPPDNEDTEVQKDKIKIAWRYEQMKQFETSVSPSKINTSKDDYCYSFDLLSRIPESTIRAARTDQRLFEIQVNPIVEEVLIALETVLKDGTEPLRICIPSFGESHWADLSPESTLSFLLKLRRLVRAHPHACVGIEVAPLICTESYGGIGWIQKLGWISDAAITLTAFTADPSLQAIFPTHHGMLSIHKLPAPHTLSPASDKLSTLRGLSAAAGSGENNLAFKCSRRRLVFETLHLDVEGGVKERRTAPAKNLIAQDAGLEQQSQQLHHSEDGVFHSHLKVMATTAIEISSPSAKSQATPLKKVKKKVAFHSERPDLYDF